MKEFNFSEKIMGTTLEVALVTSDFAKAEKAFTHVLEMARGYEHTFSRFQNGSELSRLNHQKNMRVSGSFIEVTRTAQKLHAQTCGVFNPLLQIEKLGYDVSFEKISPQTRSMVVEPYDIDMSKVQVDDTKHEITIGEKQKLDYGGFLKGFVAERIAETLSTFHGVIVNIGGDIYTHGLDAHGQKFVFSFYNPITDTLSEGFPLHNEAMATSGTYKRSWVVGEKKVSHIVDASLANPTTDIISATIIAPHGDIAEAYATTAICLGIEKAQVFLEEKSVRYALIGKDGKVTSTI
jgi:thiamine biosynthesis lipoprotein